MLKTAASGLNASQMNLRVTSDNIANVNTPGYVRKTVDQQPLVVGGMGMPPRRSTAVPLKRSMRRNMLSGLENTGRPPEWRNRRISIRSRASGV